MRCRAIAGLAQMVPGLGGYLGEDGSMHASVTIDGGYYTKTPDNLPLIGAVPNAPRGAYICAGLSGYGSVSRCFHIWEVLRRPTKASGSTPLEPSIVAPPATALGLPTSTCLPIASAPTASARGLMLCCTGKHLATSRATIACPRHLAGVMAANAAGELCAAGIDPSQHRLDRPQHSERTISLG